MLILIFFPSGNIKPRVHIQNMSRFLGKKFIFVSDIAKLITDKDFVEWVNEHKDDPEYGIVFKTTSQFEKAKEFCVELMQCEEREEYLLYMAKDILDKELFGYKPVINFLVKQIKKHKIEIEDIKKKIEIVKTILTLTRTFDSVMSKKRKISNMDRKPFVSDNITIKDEHKVFKQRTE